MVEYLSFEVAAKLLCRPNSKLRQLVIEDQQIKAVRISSNGTLWEPTVMDSQYPYGLDPCCHLSETGVITREKYKTQSDGKSIVVGTPEVGNLRIERTDLDAYIAVNGLGDSDEANPSNNSASVIERSGPTALKKERESLLKLVIGMAIKGYGYDPAALKSDKVKEIADDLALLGLSIDTDTVRKYLKEAASTLLSAKSTV